MSNTGARLTDQQIREEEHDIAMLRAQARILRKGLHSTGNAKACDMLADQRERDLNNNR